MQFAVPVFSLNGKIIVVVLMRVKALEAGGLSFTSMSTPILPMVVPAEDIFKVTKQISKE